MTISSTEMYVDVPCARILCVDQEACDLLRIPSQLSADFDLVCVASPREGHAALAIEPPFDVIISDGCTMRDGDESFARALRAHSPDAERIILTREVDLVSLAMIIGDARVMRLLPKPCSTDALRIAVADALLRHRARILRSNTPPRVTAVSGNACAANVRLKLSPS